MIKVFERTNKSIDKALRMMISDDEIENFTTIDMIRIQFFGFVALIIGITLLPVALCREMYKRYTNNRAQQKMRA